MSKLEMLRTVSEYSNALVAEVVAIYDSACPQFYQLAVDHLVARLIHTLVLKDPDALDEDLPRRVHDIVGEMQGRLPALLADIIIEHNINTEASSARN